MEKAKKEVCSEVLLSTILNHPGLCCRTFDKLLAEKEDLESQINLKVFDKAMSHKLDRLNYLFEEA